MRSRLYVILICTLVVIFLGFSFSFRDDNTRFRLTNDVEQSPDLQTTPKPSPSSTTYNTPSSSPSGTASNSETPSSTTTNSKTPSNEPEVHPTGIVYLLHLPKTGGTYLRDEIDKMAKVDKSVNQFHWNRDGKTMEEITATLDELEEAGFYDQIHFFQHHHRYPSIVEIVPVLLEYKKRCEEKGFIFDIILDSLRDPLDLSLSDYNYGKQSGFFQDLSFREYMQRKPYLLTDSIIFPTPIHLDKERTWVENGNTVDEILQPIIDALSKVDYVFFTETLDDELILYFKCVLKRKFAPISPVNVSTKYILKKELGIDLVQEFYQIHAVDQYFYSKSFSLFFEKDFC